MQDYTLIFIHSIKVIGSKFYERGIMMHEIWQKVNNKNALLKTNISYHAKIVLYFRKKPKLLVKICIDLVYFGSNYFKNITA